MADKTIEKRKFTWKITNFTREAVNKYKKDECVKSEKFEILLGDNYCENMTKWSFWFYPNREEGFCGFFIKKVAVDRDEFLFKINVAVRETDGTTAILKNFEDSSNVIKLGTVWGCPNILEHFNFFKAANKYLTNDTLTLIIDVELQQDGMPAKKTLLDFALPKWMAKNFNYQDSSDVSFICSDEKTIPAHRLILTSRSSVFKTMLTTVKAEKKSNEIIVAEDGDTMLEFMRYIYTHEVHDLKKHASKLLDCAKKYDVPDLKQYCVQEMIEQLSDENIFETMLLAKLYNERKFMHKCMDYIDTNFWKLKDTEEWKKVDSALMVNIMKYMQERSNGITFINSL